MALSKQIALLISTLGLAVLVGGYFYAFVKVQQTEPVAPFKPIYPDDPEMQIAYEKAQEGLDYFLKLADNPPKETQGFAVKARIQENERQEIFWLYPFAHDGEDFAGRLNDEPETLLKTFKGDFVEFSRRDIVDWTFDDTRLDIMQGNFTGCVELQRKAPDNIDQFQELFGLDCNK